MSSSYCTENQFIHTADLNVKGKTIRFRGKHSCDLGIGKDFPKRTLSPNHKGKTSIKLSYIEITNFCSFKDRIGRVRSYPTEC